MGALPSLTSHNAVLEKLENGNIKITFTVVDQFSRLNGQQFVHTIPAFEEHLERRDGSIAEGTLYVSELPENPPRRGTYYAPSIYMVDEDTTPLAIYDLAQGRWIPKFSTLMTGLGTQEVASWMPLPTYGKIYEVRSTHSDWIDVLFRPVRVFEENMFAANKYTKTVTWLELTLGEEGHAVVYTPVFDSDRETTGGILIHSSRPIWNDGNNAPGLRKAEVLDAIAKSPRIDLSIIQEHTSPSGSCQREQNVPMPTSSWTSGLNNYWRYCLQQDRQNNALQRQFLEEVEAEKIPGIKGVEFGYWGMSILINK
jgi:hypothetical protein